MRALILAGLLAAAPALAADPVWTEAPVPTQSRGAVTPAARAGSSTGPGHDAPFSGLPTGTVTTGGATSSSDTGAVRTPSVER